MQHSGLMLDELALSAMKDLIGKREPSEIEEVIRLAMSVAYNQGMIDANNLQIERNERALSK